MHATYCGDPITDVLDYGVEEAIGGELRRYALVLIDGEERDVNVGSIEIPRTEVVQ